MGFWPRFETQQFEHSIRKWEPISDDRARINKSMLPLEFLASDMECERCESADEPRDLEGMYSCQIVNVHMRS